MSTTPKPDVISRVLATLVRAHKAWAKERRDRAEQKRALKYARQKQVLSERILRLRIKLEGWERLAPRGEYAPQSYWDEVIGMRAELAVLEQRMATFPPFTDTLT